MKNLLKYLIPLQPMIKKAMGMIRTDEKVYNIKTDLYDFIPDFMIAYASNHSDYIRIPLTIDDSSPEASRRSLLGMIEGFVNLHYNPYLKQWVIELYDGFVLKKYSTNADTPTEAILKALCHQEGVEVK
jgi:hypothetical protein